MRDPQIRFDERQWETELWPRLRHRHQGESRRQQRLPRPTATAPAADSTFYGQIKGYPGRPLAECQALRLPCPVPTCRVKGETRS